MYRKLLSKILICCGVMLAATAFTGCGNGSGSSTTTDTTTAPAMQDTSKMMTDTSSKMMMDTTKMDTAKPRPIENPPRGKKP